MKSVLKWTGIGLLSLGAVLLIAGIGCGFGMASARLDMAEKLGRASGGGLGGGLGGGSGGKPGGGSGGNPAGGSQTDLMEQLKELKKMLEQLPEDKQKETMADFKRQYREWRAPRDQKAKAEMEQKLKPLAEQVMGGGHGRGLLSTPAGFSAGWARRRLVTTDAGKAARKAAEKDGHTWTDMWSKDVDEAKERQKSLSDGEAKNACAKFVNLAGAAKGLIITGPILMAVGGALLMTACVMADIGKDEEVQDEEQY